MSGLDPVERQIARERVKAWPPEARRALVKLTPEEVEFVGLAVAILDIRPGAPEHPRDVIDIDLR